MNSLFYFPEVDSTNDQIVQFADKKYPDFVAVYTFNQTRGRGQYGNQWKTQSGLNIAYSFMIRADSISLPPVIFNFKMTLVLSNFTDKMTGQESVVKWPNDLIIKNKKVVGILLEKRMVNNQRMLIGGFGINVLQKDFQHYSKGGSILTQTGKTFELHDFAKELHQYFKQNLFQKTTVAEVLKQYNRHLFRKDKISVFELNGIQVNGIIRNVDAEGYIHIEMEDQDIRKFFFKEIKLLY